MFEAELAVLREANRKQPYPELAYRLAQLNKLELALKNHQPQLIKAVSADFGHRSAKETETYELLPSLEELRFARAHLKQWMAKEKRGPSFWLQSAESYVQAQPKGVVGIMVPWNYPIFLAFGPLIAAIAAGNKVILKLSEDATETAKAIQSILSQYFDLSDVTVVTGGIECSQAFSKLPLDHLLFTGSTQVGFHILNDAAKTMKPVTLELGGKSPVLLGQTANMDVTVKRVINGKLLNAGQTCVAPDYLMCHPSQVEEFIAKAKTQVAYAYPNILDNDNYTSIINDRQYQRLQTLLEDAKDKGATVIPLADDAEQTTDKPRRVMPCILLNATPDMQLMQQEIFGPILPVMTVPTMDAAVEHVNQGEKPLAFYYFGHDKQEQEYVLKHTLSGGVTINGVICHVAEPALPFGGVGLSGMGQYHGREGFETFSHKRAIFKQNRLSTIDWVSAPFGRFSDLANKLIHNIDLQYWSSIAQKAALVILGALAAYAIWQLAIPATTAIALHI